MATTEKKAKSTRKRSGGVHEPARRRKKAELVERVIENFEKKLASDEVKPTVGDLIRLLQLEQELNDEEPKEIRVSWVEPSEKEHATDK